MKLQSALAGALASAVIAVALSAMTPSPAAAEVRMFEAMRASGEHVVIDGPCLSACTLLLGILPRDHICVTRQAVLGFHAASYYDDTSRSLVPTREGTRLVMQVYPPQIRSWIGRHGGLRPALIELRGRELAEMYPACR
jgi:hypothetical protein